MRRSTTRLRVLAPLPLAALALSLGMPATAVAETTPAPSPTTSASATASTSASPSPTASETAGETAAPSPTGSPSAPATTTPTTDAPTPSLGAPAAPSASGSASATPSATAPSESVPFEGRSGAASRRLAGTATQQAGYAGGYIARTLSASGDHYTYPGGDFFDGGNTIDAVLALDGAKVGLTSADAALRYLEEKDDAYVGAGGETYAGPLGKLVLGVVAHGADPTDFGGQDLVARLEGLLKDDGRFSDVSAYGDYSNTIGQSLDVIALGRATGGVDESALDFLLAQQCADGGFRGNLAPAGGTCTSDLDATSIAAQALVGFGFEDEAADALDLLAARQQDSGGFVSGDGVTNANTTGLAAQAFAAGGRSTGLSSAQGFLAGLQLDCAADPAVRGGIPFAAADRATLLKTPTDQDAVDKMLRATPQATLGLAGGTLLDVTSDGASATAPTADCSTSPTATPSSTPTSPSGTVTPSATVDPTTAGPTTGGPSTQVPVAGPDSPSAGPGLAYTGSSLGLPLTLATLLLLAGAAAIVLSRRRGAHL